MAKRAIIAPGVIRISKPGFDVDTANELGFLLHENFLFAQPFFRADVSSPVGGGDVIVNFPNVTDHPIVFLYPMINSDFTAWPNFRSRGSTSPVGGARGLLNMAVNYHILNATQIRINFPSGGNVINVTRAILTLLRRAD